MTAPANTPVSTPAGEAKVSGKVAASNGRFDQAEEATLQGQQMRNAQGLKPKDDGSFEVESVDTFEGTSPDGISYTLSGALGVVFRDGILTADHVDSFVKSSSLTTNVNQLTSPSGPRFTVDSADSFSSGCVTLVDLQRVEVAVGDVIEVVNLDGSEMGVVDCSYLRYKYSGQGTLRMEKRSGGTFYLENGKLEREGDNYDETVETEQQATIETDAAHGFTCSSIQPPGSYHYNDQAIEKDLTIHVPEEGQTYRLCLRKSVGHHYTNYDGQIDFVDNFMELNGVVQYKRYFLRNNEITEPITKQIYTGQDGALQASMVYDPDFLFLNSLSQTGLQGNFASGLSRSRPNNYYTIMEENRGNDYHRLVRLDMSQTQFSISQPLTKRYSTDTELPTITLQDNVLEQDNGQNNLKILPPGHEEIQTLLG